MSIAINPTRLQENRPSAWSPYHKGNEDRETKWILGAGNPSVALQTANSETIISETNETANHPNTTVLIETR